MVPITLECLLFLEHGPLAGSLGIALGWTKVSSPSVLSPWDADLDNMDWTAFQGGAMQFLAMHATHLLPNMEDANLSKKIDWFASITNRPKGAPDLTFLVKGNVGFLHFREAALAANPGHLKVRMSMIDPRDLTPLLVQAGFPRYAHPVVYGLLAQSFKRKITTDPNLEHQTNHPDEPVPKHHCKGAAIDLDEIEIIELEPAIQSPGPSNGPPEKKILFPNAAFPDRHGENSHGGVLERGAHTADDVATEISFSNAASPTGATFGAQMKMT
ncbi:hypothetical protein H4Q26_014815 [Puccinia striiformis f. sp. tritici PST-130]|nr:hypothetical protein H4Q26_014815 [Puccinia striiformis f. sp. tritici PST-130]